MQLIFKSETVSWTSGGSKGLPLDFLPRRGPRGGRLVIEEIMVESQLSLTTDASTSMVGDDMATFIKEIRIKDAGGTRRKLKGAHIRIFAQQDMGDMAPVDPSNLAASQTAALRIFYHHILFANRRSLREFDCALPVDDLVDGGEIVFDMPANADLLATGGTVTINTASSQYIFYFLCREEFDVEFHARDEQSYLTKEGDLTAKVPVMGNLLRACHVWKDAAGGGTSVTSTTITDVTADLLWINQIKSGALTAMYLSQSSIFLSTDDIFNNSKICPIVWPRRFAKITDYPRLAGQLLIRLTGTWTGGEVIYHLIAPKSERVMAAAAAANGVDARTAQVSTKTEGKTKRDVAAHGQLAAFMPWKTARPG